MISITNYPSLSKPARLEGIAANRNGRAATTKNIRFQSILAAMEARHSKNIYKSRGLTIADYRARAVFTKSHFRPHPWPARTETKNGLSQRRSEDSIKPANSPIPQDIEDKESIDGIEKPPTHAPLQSTALNHRQIIEENVQKAAAKYNLPPALIKAVIQAESNFQVDAVSAAGAQGLMQLMPATAEALGVTNPFDIEQNIEGGTRYLRKMLDRFGGSVRKALSAYNAGPGTVLKYNGQVPYPETRQYVRRVLRFSRQMT